MLKLSIVKWHQLLAKLYESLLTELVTFTTLVKKDQSHGELGPDTYLYACEYNIILSHFYSSLIPTILDMQL